MGAQAMTSDREPLGFDTGPADPFLNDPLDPSSLLDAVEPTTPLSDQERRDVAADLAELTTFAEALSPRGVCGVVVECADCGEPHYFGWALMQENLRALLGSGSVHAHEPAFEPDATAYVTWDYARGYTDALTRS